MRCPGGDWWWAYREIGCAVVVQADLTHHPVHEASALKFLDAKEMARLRRFRQAKARRQFLLCRAALRMVLCSWLECSNKQLAFATTEHGKPFALVAGYPVPVSFNVSHSGSFGLLAFAAQGRLGVDVEEPSANRDIDIISRAVFTSGEIADLEAVPEEGRLQLFLKFWTLKEALIKALGTGLYLDPSRFEIPLSVRRGETKSIFRFPHLPAVGWRLDYLEDEQFAAALAQELQPAPRFGVELG